jgi:hypothetical protein
MLKVMEQEAVTSISSKIKVIVAIIKQEVSLKVLTLNNKYLSKIMEIINARTKSNWLISNTLNKQDSTTHVMSSISNITKNAFFQKIRITIKIAITNKIRKFRQVNNVHTLYMEISLITITKMIDTMGMVATNSNTLVMITNTEEEGIKVVECIKILFKTIITTMMREILITINLLIIQLVCKVIINNLSREAVIIQEVNNSKVHSKSNSIDWALSMKCNNTTHNYKTN